MININQSGYAPAQNKIVVSFIVISLFTSTRQYAAPPVEDIVLYPIAYDQLEWGRDEYHCNMMDQLPLKSA
jgi:hypothetical protein